MRHSGNVGLVFFVVVEHVVANLSMVLVRETDDRLLSVIFFLCVHITHYLYYTESCYCMLTIPPTIAEEQLVLYYTVIYYFM